MRREATYNRAGNRRGMVCGGASSLSLTPEARLTIQDSPEFLRLMEEYYERYPYMRADMEKEENILTGNSCAAIDLDEETARQQDDHDAHIDQRPF
jgi:hypothetical protein